MGYVAFILVLLVLVLVHEFGHFIVAKKSGIRVDEFGFGFPPKLFGIKRGETEYSFNALPIGGFVRIYGETPDKENMEGEDRDRSFVNKPAYIQAMVLVAGVFFNMLLAWILFSAILMMGVPYVLSNVPDGTRVTDAALRISAVSPQLPAEQAGLLPGDSIIDIRSGDDVLQSDVGIALDTFMPQFQEFIARHAKDGIVLDYRRNGVVGRTDNIIPILNTDKTIPVKYLLGISLNYVGTMHMSFFPALWEGAQQTWFFATEMVRGFATLISNSIQGSADYSEIAGPVGIANVVHDAAQAGIVRLLFITAIISINLAVLNLLPFPALDGGRLFFLIIEKIKGSPIKPKVANAVNMVGFIILLLLMVGVTYLDISRLLVS